MSPRTLNRTQSRMVDQIAIEDYGINSLDLMEAAGSGCARILLKELSSDAVVHLVCGKGNNGGDGFVIARLLHQNSCAVEIWMSCQPEQLSNDAKANYERCAEQNLNLHDATSEDLQPVLKSLRSEDWIVDALLGTGLTSPPRSPFREWIDWINHSPAQVMAVDLPSGMNADTGEAMEIAVQAEQTCTFVTQKTGFLNPQAKALLGNVHVIDLPVPEEIIEKASRT